MPFPINANMVKEAFHRTGLVPTQDIWYGEGKACGLAAVAFDRLGEQGAREIQASQDYARGDSIRLVTTLLEISESQGLSFIMGFDGDPWYAFPGRSRQAYNVGRKAAQLVGLCV